MPWSLIVLPRLDTGAMMTGVVLVLCMLLNIAVLALVARFFHRRRPTS
jgi:hypothetical protein